MNEYTVVVKKCGTTCKTVHGVVAEAALQAMDFVEARITKKRPHMEVDPATDKMTVRDWHGYCFVARRTA